MKLSFVQNFELALYVLRDAGTWLLESGKKPSKWWDLKNLNKSFLLQFASEEEFFVGCVDGAPAVAAVLQVSSETKEWEDIDCSRFCPALYVHWLCVAREFAGNQLSTDMILFAKKIAKQKDAKYIRVDTNASSKKLRDLYEGMGFTLVGIKKEEYRNTALYQITVS